MSFYRDLVPGNRSSTYIWDAENKNFRAELRNTPQALLDSPEISFVGKTTGYPEGAVIGVEGRTGALRVHARRAFNEELFVDLKMKPVDFLQSEGSLPFKMEIGRNSYLVREEAGELRFHNIVMGDNYALKRAYEARMDPKSAEFIWERSRWRFELHDGKARFVALDGDIFEKIAGNAPDIEASIPIGAEGKPSRVRFFRNENTGEWGTALQVAPEQIRTASAPPLSAAAFHEKFPHNLQDLSQGQTVVRIDGVDFMVKSYDPRTNQVLLEHEEIRLLQGSPRITSNELSRQNLTIQELMKDDIPQLPLHYGEGSWIVDKESSNSKSIALYRWVGSGEYREKEYRTIPIQLTTELYFPGFEQKASELRPGQIIQDSKGSKYEVRSVGEHGQGKVFLRSVSQTTLDWGQWNSVTQNPALLHVLPSRTATPRAPSAPAEGLLARIFPWLKPVDKGNKDIPLVGSAGVKLLESQAGFFDQFTATKQEINPLQVFRDLLGGSYPAGTKIEAVIDHKTLHFVVGESDWLWQSKLKEIGSGARDSQLYKLDRLAITKPGDLKPFIMEKQYIATPSGDSVLKFFDISPVSGTDLKYQVVGPSGPTIVHVRYPNAANAADDAKLRKIADELVANLPKAHPDAQGLILLESGEHYLDQAVALASDGKIEGKSVRQISMLRKALDSEIGRRLEHFWHETGHSIAQKLWNNQRIPGVEWARAASMDGKFISGYSMRQYEQKLGRTFAELSEDFAETVSAYISTDGGRLQPQLRKRFPNRFAVLDRIFAIQEVKAETQIAISQASAANGLVIMPFALGTAYYFSDARSKQR